MFESTPSCYTDTVLKCFHGENICSFKGCDVFENENSYSISHTAEPAYSYIVYSRLSAIVELNLVHFAFISLLSYPCYNKLLL